MRSRTVALGRRVEQLRQQLVKLRSRDVEPGAFNATAQRCAHNRNSFAGAASATLRTELAALPGAFSWQFDLATGARTLGDGVYWLALHDGPLDPSGFTGSSLIWETTDAPGAYDTQTFSIDESWSPGDQVGLAFELRAAPVVATPEPGTLALLTGGLLSLSGVSAGVRRRKRGTKAT